MTSIFAQLGTQWGAIYYQKVSGGQKIKEGAWLVLEIGFKRYRFLTIAGGTELGIRTLPDSSKKKVGVTPPHLANGGALWRYLAYVVEGHASACPRTVGVGKCVWCCLILPSYVYFNLKWYPCVWHLWTSFRSLRWTKALFNKLILWKK